MRIETVLNKCLKFKHFIIKKTRFSEKGDAIIFEFAPRKNSKPICSQCKLLAPGYDTLPVRKFQFIPIWGFLIYFEVPSCSDLGI